MTNTLIPSLPPLECLAAAIVASKVGSFTQAAIELGVSHGAISRRIAALEGWAGIALFKRHGRGVKVTADGQRILARIEHAFDIVDQAAGAWRKSGRLRTVKIATTLSFARLWLIPRIAEIEAELDNVRIELLTGHEHANLANAEADLAIRCGRGGWKVGFERRLFAKDIAFPVASRDFVLRNGPFDSPRSILEAKLIHSIDTESWQAWALSQGLRLGRKSGHRVMGDHTLALSAVKAGLGIGLFVSPLAELKDEPELEQIGKWQSDNPLTYFVITDPNVVTEKGAQVADKVCALAQN